MLRPLVLVTNEQEKILGKSAVTLYRVLRRLRGKKPLGDGVMKELSWLAFEADLDMRTTKRALARLKECGAVRTTRVYLDNKGPKVRVFVRGKISRKRLRLPDTFLEWVEPRQKPGRPAGAKDSYQRTRRYNVVTYKNQNGSEKANDTKALRNKDDPSISSNYESTRSVSFPLRGKRDALRADLGSFPRREQSSLMSPEEIQHLLSRGTIDEVEAKLLAARPSDPPKPCFTFEDGRVDYVSMMRYRDPGVARVLAHRKANPRPSKVGPPPKLPPLCQPHRVKLGYDEIELGLDKGKVLVRRVFEGYEEAASAVLGNRRNWRAWSDGKHAKDLVTHAKILKAARVLRDNGIAPGAWAHWRLDFARKRGMRIPGPSQVFVASKIEELVETFHDTYDGPQGTKLMGTKDHQEQLCRHQEAIAIWENKSRRPLVGMPKWYADIRKKEIARGITDPLVCYMKVD